MARFPRIVIPGCPHHIINRGNRRQRVFFSDEDRRFFLDLIKNEADKVGIDIWAYCLMDNHVHLVAVPETTVALAKGVGSAQRKHALRVNSRNEWKGHLWQERFESCPLGESHLFMAVRYIEQNPKRANIVKRAVEYRWSSARSHVYGEKDELLSENPFVSGIGDWTSYLEMETDDLSKKLLRTHTKTGRPLGDEKFIDEIEKLTGRNLKRKKTGPKKQG